MSERSFLGDEGNLSEEILGMNYRIVRRTIGSNISNDIIANDLNLELFGTGEEDYYESLGKKDFKSGAKANLWRIVIEGFKRRDSGELSSEETVHWISKMQRYYEIGYKPIQGVTKYVKVLK